MRSCGHFWSSEKALHQFEARSTSSLSRLLALKPPNIVQVACEIAATEFLMTTRSSDHHEYDGFNLFPLCCPLDAYFAFDGGNKLLSVEKQADRTSITVDALAS